MFDALGLGVGNTLFAGIAVAMGVPFPIFLWFYGERLRARSSASRALDRDMASETST